MPIHSLVYVLNLSLMNINSGAGVEHSGIVLAQHA